MRVKIHLKIKLNLKRISTAAVHIKKMEICFSLYTSPEYFQNNVFFLNIFLTYSKEPMMALVSLEHLCGEMSKQLKSK